MKIANDISGLPNYMLEYTVDFPLESLLGDIPPEIQVVSTDIPGGAILTDGESQVIVTEGKAQLLLSLLEGCSAVPTVEALEGHLGIEFECYRP